MVPSSVPPAPLVAVVPGGRRLSVRSRCGPAACPLARSVVGVGRGARLCPCFGVPAAGLSALVPVAHRRRRPSRFRSGRPSDRLVPRLRAGVVALPGCLPAGRLCCLLRFVFRVGGSRRSRRFVRRFPLWRPVALLMGLAFAFGGLIIALLLPPVASGPRPPGSRLPAVLAVLLLWCSVLVC